MAEIASNRSGGGGDTELGASETFDVTLSDAATNAATTIQTYTHQTSGSPAAGLGMSILYKIEDSGGGNETYAAIRVTATDVTNTSEDGRFEIALVAAGSLPAAGSGQFIINGSDLCLLTSGKIRWGGPSGTDFIHNDGGNYLVFYQNSTEKLRIAATYISVSSGAPLRAADSGSGTIYGSFDSAGSLTLTGSSHATSGPVILGSLMRLKTTATISASTTQSQGQGALVSSMNEISVCANAGDTVTLPSAAAGMVVFLTNNGAQSASVFPASGDNAGAGVNTAVTLAAGASAMFVAYDADNWRVF